MLGAGENILELNIRHKEATCTFIICIKKNLFDNYAYHSIIRQCAFDKAIALNVRYLTREHHTEPINMLNDHFICS